MYTRGIADGGCCAGWLRCRAPAVLCRSHLQHWGGGLGVPEPHTLTQPLRLSPLHHHGPPTPRGGCLFFFFFFTVQFSESAQHFPPKTEKVVYNAVFSPNNLKGGEKDPKVSFPPHLPVHKSKEKQNSEQEISGHFEEIVTCSNISRNYPAILCWCKGLPMALPSARPRPGTLSPSSPQPDSGMSPFSHQ